jgi:hypothetical protein
MSNKIGMIEMNLLASANEPLAYDLTEEFSDDDTNWFVQVVL